MTTNNSSGQIDLGHWLLRLVAYIIDAIIIGIVTVIFAIIIGIALAITAFATGGLFSFSGLGFWFSTGIFGLLSILYFIVLDVIWGGTVGKRLMGLRVQTTTGRQITFDKSFIRNISKIFVLFLFLDWLIGVLTDGDKRQKVSDRYAGTIVIQTREPFQTAYSMPPSYPPPPPPT